MSGIRLTTAIIAVFVLSSMSFVFASDRKCGPMKSESGKVWIDGIQKLEWGKNQVRTIKTKLKKSERPSSEV